MCAQSHVVLVVDDDEGIRESLTTFLEDEGYGVMSAANGREALDRLRAADTPCLILLDLMMPVMDGVAFLNEKVADPALASIPVVVITAAEHIDKDSLAAAAVLSKPLEIERLLGALDQHCCC